MIGKLFSFCLLFSIAVQNGATSARRTERRFKNRLDSRFQLKLHYHGPCAYVPGKSLWIEKFCMPDQNEATLEPIRKKPGCFRLRGGVAKVFQPIEGRIQMHLEIRTDADENLVPQPCRGVDKNTACGGYGSCLYCDPCEILYNEARNNVRLSLGRKRLDCHREIIEAGKYDNLNLRFCLPTIKQFLNSQNITAEDWQEITSELLPTLTIWITVRLFNTDVSSILLHQRTIENSYRRVALLPNDAPLPINVWRQLPFNRMLAENRGFIGCHEIQGDLIFKQ